MCNMTIYDIAEEAGVSITTVSRVINGKSGIKESTRIKVQKVLDKYDYVPSLSAKGLVMKCTYIVTILMADIRDEHYTATAYMIEQEMSKYGYSCLLCSTGRNLDKMIYYLKTMAQRQVDGIILIGSIFQNQRIQETIKIHLSNIPIVMANGYLDLPNVSGILCDERLGMIQAVEYLIDKGHQHIAYIKDSDTPSGQTKKIGYIEGMTRNGLQENVLIQESENTFEAGKKTTENILNSFKEITAIVYGEDLTAIGGLNAIYKKQQIENKKVAVVGFNNSSYAQMSIPTLTSIDNKLTAMGAKAAQTLREMMQGKKVVSQALLVSELIVRESTEL